MIISHASDGAKAGYSLNGTILTVGDVSVDLQERQRTTECVIDICLDNQLKTMREGLSAWYVANIIIPPKKYTLQPTGQKDENDDDIMEEVGLPIDTSQVELRLWGLPPQYFEQLENDNLDDEQGDEE